MRKIKGTVTPHRMFASFSLLSDYIIVLFVSRFAKL